MCSVWPVVSHLDGSSFFNFSEFYVVVFFEIQTCNRVVLLFCERTISQILWTGVSARFCHRAAVGGCVDAEHGSSQ